MSSNTDVEKAYTSQRLADERGASAYHAPQPLRQLGNPGPLGLSAFAATTFVLSLVNLSARDVTVPNVVLGMAYFYGGLVQLLAGMWEFGCGNTFGATALSSYGGFWLSYAVIETPSFGVVAAYAGNGEMVRNALGFYLFAWFIFTFLMLVCTLRTTVAFVFLFFTLDMAFLFLAISELLESSGCKKTGGWFGLLAAFTAWYCALAGLLTKENSFFLVPVGPLPWAPKNNDKRDS